MPRQVNTSVNAKQQSTGDDAKLFGPDATGAIDTDAEIVRLPYVSGFQIEVSWLLDGRWLQSGPWLGNSPFAGFLEWPFLTYAYLAEPARRVLPGDTHRFGSKEYGARAIDSPGNQSSATLNTAEVFIASTPEREQSQSAAIASNVVTVTVT